MLIGRKERKSKNVFKNMFYNSIFPKTVKEPMINPHSTIAGKENSGIELILNKRKQGNPNY